jgi:hypothetical protein
MSDTPSAVEPIDWAALFVELDLLARSYLGRRAQKISNILAESDRSEAGAQAAIERVRRTTLRFVDPIRVADLVDEMTARLAARTGSPVDRRQSGFPNTGAYADPGVSAAFLNGGCLGGTAVAVCVVVGLVFRAGR